MFYELAFHFNPHCAEACNNLGVIYKDRDNLDKAVECYQVMANDNHVNLFSLMLDCIVSLSQPFFLFCGYAARLINQTKLFAVIK